MESKLEKLEKFEKSENSRTDEERKDQDEENLCRSIIKGLARRSRKKHTILAEVEEEDPCVLCTDYVNLKELPGDEVRQAREQELKYFRDLRVLSRSLSLALSPSLSLSLFLSLSPSLSLPPSPLPLPPSLSPTSLPM